MGERIERYNLSYKINVIDNKKLDNNMVLQIKSYHRMLVSPYSGYVKSMLFV